MTQVSIRVDDQLKDQAEQLFTQLGINMSTALTMFLRQAVREGGIPFAVTTKTDPFYTPANLAHIERSIRQLEAGQTVTRSIEDLERMADA
jgi:DNA-damage-inducible protein J